MSPLFGRLKRNKAPRLHCSAVVAAAGSSTRMDGQDKLLLLLGDIPILARTLRALEDCALIDEIVVVTRADLIVPVSQLCKDFGCEKVTCVVVGGATRAHSVLAGVQAVRDSAELIAIHDGARPFVTSDVIERAVLRAQVCGAAAAAMPVHDTIKCASGGFVSETLNRDILFAVQTPQVFEASLLKAALQKAIEDGVAITDDCSAVERLGMTVALTAGSDENIKLTTPADLSLGMGILYGRGESV